MPKYDLKCPKCRKPLGFLPQVREWVEMVSEEDVEPPTFLNIWCNTCESMTTTIYWEENGPNEEFEVPNLRETMAGADRFVINRPLNEQHGSEV